MAKPAKYIAVYDVTDDDERLRLAKVVEGFGIRVQKSAFECYLTKGARSQFERRVNELGIKSGYLFLYHLDSKGKRLAMGTPPSNPFDDRNYAFVV